MHDVFWSDLPCFLICMFPPSVSIVVSQFSLRIPTGRCLAQLFTWQRVPSKPQRRLRPALFPSTSPHQLLTPHESLQRVLLAGDLRVTSQVNRAMLTSITVVTTTGAPSTRPRRRASTRLAAEVSSLTIDLKTVAWIPSASRLLRRTRILTHRPRLSLRRLNSAEACFSRRLR
jgi:hypothetical protein